MMHVSDVQPRLKSAFAVLFGLAAVSAHAAHTKASLVLADTMARPGSTVLAGIHLHMDPGWHTYWKNSGASGIPTTVKWDLPAGVSAGDIQWPVPEKLPPDDLATYIYRNDVVLIVPLKLDSGIRPGRLDLKANVSWLECKAECVPGSAGISATLTVGQETQVSTNAALIGSWQKKLPERGKNLSAHAWWAGPPRGDMRQIILEWTPPAAASRADFFPYGYSQFEVQGAVERLPGGSDEIRIRKPVKKYGGNWPRQISGLLIQESGGQRLAYEASMQISSNAEPAAAAAARPPSSAGESRMSSLVFSQPMWRMLLYAFLGGIILNVMPCVLPVIALKILGFVGEARSDPRHVRKLGLTYALGVLASFVALAALVIGVKAAGHQAGWGMQFKSPEFIVVLTVLVTLVALNLFGVFEVNPGGRVLGAASALASRQGYAGAFFNGVLATVLATPCTAPVLGTALGYAFLQKAPTILLMLVTVGIGLAFPYVVLSWQPAWLKFLPKPGLWMQRFKVVMGFPMLATAVWLFSLTPDYYGERSWWLGVFLVVVGLGAWVYGEFVQRGRTRRWLGVVAMLGLLIGGYAYVVEGQLNWRRPIPVTASTQPIEENTGIQWRAWSPEAVAQAQQQGRPVLVDFTAAWCVTCQANKRFAIDIPSVRSKLKQIGAVAFLGDYTRFPDNITRELNHYGRAGVPLVLVYPGKPGAKPFVLPELLTPGIVLGALNRAAS